MSDVSPSLVEAATADGCIFYGWPVTEQMCDPLIWPAVKRINESGWVVTGESCQGHPDAGAPGVHTAWDHNMRPYLRLIVHEDHLGEMTARMMRAVESLGDDVRMEHGWMPYGPSIALWYESRGDYAQVLAYAQASNVGQRDLGCAVYREFGDLLCQWSPGV